MFVWLSRLLGGIFGLKTFIGGLLMVIMGVILYNLCVEITEEILNFTLSQVNDVTFEGGITSPSVSGFAGWLMAQLKVPECLSVIITCVSLRFVLRKIPFLRW